MTELLILDLLSRELSGEITDWSILRIQFFLNGINKYYGHMKFDDSKETIIDCFRKLKKRRIINNFSCKKNICNASFSNNIVCVEFVKMLNFQGYVRKALKLQYLLKEVI